jgi:hypothetical protein
LEDVARSWLAAVIERGQPIPEPFEEQDFSGKFVLRIPRSLHKRAAFAAERDGISLNQFISNSVAIQIGIYDGRKAVSVNNATALQVFNVVNFVSDSSKGVITVQPYSPGSGLFQTGGLTMPALTCEFERRIVNG